MASADRTEGSPGHTRTPALRQIHAAGQWERGRSSQQMVLSHTESSTWGKSWTLQQNAYTWRPSVTSADAPHASLYGLGCKKPGFTWDVTNTHSMEEEAEKLDYNKNKNFRSLKHHQELNKPQREYICETQMSQKSSYPRTCKGQPQTMKGKQLQRHGRSEDQAGGPEKPGGRGAAGPEHCDHPGHSFLPPGTWFLRADCRGRAGGWGARQQGQLLWAPAAVVRREPWVPTSTLTVLADVLNQASHELRAARAPR